MEHSCYGLKFGEDWPLPPAYRCLRAADADFGAAATFCSRCEGRSSWSDPQSVLGGHSFWSDLPYTISGYSPLYCSTRSSHVKTKLGQRGLMHSSVMCNLSIMSDVLDRTARALSHARKAPAIEGSAPTSAEQKNIKSMQVAASQIQPGTETDQQGGEHILPKALWHHKLNPVEEHLALPCQFDEYAQRSRAERVTCGRDFLLRYWVAAPPSNSRSVPSLASIIEEDGLNCA